jgi:hypothetical protein
MRSASWCCRSLPGQGPCAPGCSLRSRSPTRSACRRCSRSDRAVAVLCLQHHPAFVVVVARQVGLHEAVRAALRIFETMFAVLLADQRVGAGQQQEGRTGDRDARSPRASLIGQCQPARLKVLFERLYSSTKSLPPSRGVVEHFIDHHIAGFNRFRKRELRGVAEPLSHYRGSRSRWSTVIVYSTPTTSGASATIHSGELLLPLATALAPFRKGASVYAPLQGLVASRSSLNRSTRVRRADHLHAHERRTVCCRARRVHTVLFAGRAALRIVARGPVGRAAARRRLGRCVPGSSRRRPSHVVVVPASRRSPRQSPRRVALQFQRVPVIVERRERGDAHTCSEHSCKAVRSASSVMMA